MPATEWENVKMSWVKVVSQWASV